jgi:integrase
MLAASYRANMGQNMGGEMCMGRAIHKLTALQVAKLTAPGLHLDGGGLYLAVSPTGSKKWVFRFKRRDMGLGGYPVVSLADARQKAIEAREILAQGGDPIEARKVAVIPTKTRQCLTFDEAAERYIAAHEAAWRNPKHRQQWRNTLASYASPVIGTMDVAEIDTPDILNILEPIWREKTETASRLRGRLETVLDWCKVRGFRTSDNPARWRGHLAHLLPARSKIAVVEHHSSHSYQQMPEFMAKLRERDALAARALEFCILTATRTSETLDAKWSEIDLAVKVWIIPALRMKNGRSHRVPLTDAALTLLINLPRLDGSDYVFPGERQNRPLSNMAFLMLLRRMGYGHLTAHGFRTSFRTWAAECTSFPRELAEMSLSHSVGSAVERAYQRSDLFTKRQALMEAWSEHVCPMEATACTDRTYSELRV